MPILVLDSVGKDFPTRAATRRVLRDVKLSVEEGEFICILGCSGSGKTTLVSMIAGLIAPSSGHVLLNGKPVEGPGPDRGVVFQNYSLLPWMNVYENVHLAVDAVSNGASEEEKKKRTEHFIGMVNLTPAMRKTPAELSGGMRQRVSVARGLAMNPRVLLLDEPFSALDALTRSNLQDELGKIWMENKTTVVMVTNDVEEAILLSDRIYLLSPGPGATLGDPISVSIPRPRIKRELSLDPEYQRIRLEIIRFFTAHKAELAAAKPAK